MAKRRVVPKLNKKRIFLLSLLCLGVMCYFFVTAFNYIFDISSLSHEEKVLKNDLISLQEEEVNLNKELDKLKNDEYKARYAREYFLYSKNEGEYIFSIDDDGKNTVEKDESNDLYKYLIIAGVGFLFLIVIIFIRLNHKKEDN